jgi:hypothetical protein
MMGTFYGQRIEYLVGVVAGRTNDYVRLASTIPVNRRQIDSIIHQLEADVDALKNEFRLVPNRCGEMTRVLDDIDALTRSAHQSALEPAPIPGQLPGGGFPQDPFGVPGGSSGYYSPVSQESLDAAYELKRTNEQFSNYVGRIAVIEPGLRNFHRDLLIFQTNIDELIDRMTRGGRGVRRSFAQVQQIAVNIENSIRGTKPEIRRAFRNISFQVNNIASALGVRSEHYVSQGAPVLIDQPMWDRMPYQVDAYARRTDRVASLVAECDQLAGVVDSILSAWQPAVGLGSRAFDESYARLQEMQHSLARIRERASGGETMNRLEDEAERLEDRYRKLNDRVRDASREVSGLDSPAYRSLNDAVKRIRKLADD